MIFNETCHRCLQHLSHLESQLISRFSEFVLIEPCHRAREAYRQFRTVVEVDISHEKLCEAIDDEIVDFRYVPMPGTERREGSQKASLSPISLEPENFTLPITLVDAYSKFVVRRLVDDDSSIVLTEPIAKVVIASLERDDGL